jgi:DNA-binding NarL/FixJ family response regulator
VPAFGPSGHDGLFLINAPLEQPLSNRYIADVRRDLLEFHLAYADVELLTEPPIRLAAGEHDLLLGFASGLRTEAIAAKTDRSQRATEDRLKKLRNRLESATTIEAATKAVRLGLIL